MTRTTLPQNGSIGLRATYTTPQGTTITQLRVRGFESHWDAHAYWAKFTRDQSRAGLPFGGCTIGLDTLLDAAPEAVTPQRPFGWRHENA